MYLTELRAVHKEAIQHMVAGSWAEAAHEFGNSMKMAQNCLLQVRQERARFNALPSFSAQALASKKKVANARKQVRVENPYARHS